MMFKKLAVLFSVALVFLGGCAWKSKTESETIQALVFGEKEMVILGEQRDYYFSYQNSWNQNRIPEFQRWMKSDLFAQSQSEIKLSLDRHNPKQVRIEYSAQLDVKNLNDKQIEELKKYGFRLVEGEGENQQYWTKYLSAEGQIATVPNREELLQRYALSTPRSVPFVSYSKHFSVKETLHGVGALALAPLAIVAIPAVVVVWGLACMPVIMGKQTGGC